MVKEQSVIFIIVELIFSLVFPAVLYLLWRHKTKEKIGPALIGALTFFVFAIILEGILHAFFLVMDSPVSRAIQGNPWLYMLYGGLAAGIFEETGRFFAFKVLLKNKAGKRTAITYGIGHGGFECMYILGFTMVNYLILILVYGGLGPELFAGTEQQMSALFNTLNSMDLFSVLAACFERLVVVPLHIALSVLVFAAVRCKGKFWMYPLAVLLHAGVDFFAVLYQTGILGSIWIIEGIILLYTIAVSLFAWRVYKRMHTDTNPIEKAKA